MRDANFDFLFDQNFALIFVEILDQILDKNYRFLGENIVRRLERTGILNVLNVNRQDVRCHSKQPDLSKIKEKCFVEIVSNETSRIHAPSAIEKLLG